ncbi:MAG: FAD-dependent oxidoreductase [Gammaproteobacteria bacterium]|nr:FAD-dependent oxidoreductase [Gammaproteobacteria bacterium]
MLMNQNIPTHAQIVVIGGGIIGCSTAYHLAKEHNADVVLLERGKLTCGTTFHAAGLVGQLRSSASITRLLKYSVELYERLETETGLATGWKQNGGLRLANNQERWIEIKRQATTARSFGLEMHLLTPGEAKEVWPLMDISDLVGAALLPTDGQANPADITQSLAKGARMNGAQIFEEVSVIGFDLDKGRVSAVQTTSGTIICEKVVNCGGQWAPEIGGLCGVSVPLKSMQHQYLVTEAIDGIDSGLPTLRDPDRLTYFKEEVGGLVMGGYEANPMPWDVEKIPEGFVFSLLDENWDHFAQLMDQAMIRVPALETAGIKTLTNGPESFTPDGNFILGESPEVGGFFVGAGFNAFGIASGGGAGKALAAWVVNGEQPMDLWSVDIRRFSSLHHDRSWVRERTIEACAKHYTMAWPFEEHSSGRPRLTSPLYQRLKARNASFGSRLGWERPNWFAAAGVEPVDQYSFGRQNWFSQVGEEHRACRERVALFDQSSFAKFELQGTGAEAALSWICANDVAKPVGSLVYTQMLNSRGGIECDLTVARIAEDAYYIVTGTGFRVHDAAWIRQNIPSNCDAVLHDITEQWATLSLMGPRSRDVLKEVTATDVSAQAFAFGTLAEIEIAGHPLRALRITYMGELGWELHVPIEASGDVYDALMAAGEKYGIANAGYRAIESLRLEKGYRAWGADITPSDSPYEAGLGWAVKLKSRRPFLGREAAEAAFNKPREKLLCCFTVDAPDVVLSGRETILRNGEPVGYLSSAGWGYTIGRNIGYGYVRHSEGVDLGYLQSGSYELEVACERVACKIHFEPLYDPNMERVKA